MTYVVVRGGGEGEVPDGVRALLARHAEEIFKYEKDVPEDGMVVLVCLGGDETHGVIDAADVESLKREPELSAVLKSMSKPTPKQMAMLVLLGDYAAGLLVERKAVEFDVLPGGRA